MNKAISILGLVASIATAVTAQLTAVNPKIGAWVLLGGTVASSAGGAIKKFGSGGPAVTAVGLIVAVAGVLAMATDLIPATYASIIAIVGTAASAAGHSLFGWTDEQPVIGSEVKSKDLSILLAVGLLGCTSLLSGCGDDQYRKAEIGVRDIYVGLQGAGEAIDAIYDYRVAKLEGALTRGDIGDAEFQTRKKDAAQDAIRAREGLKGIGIAVKQFKEQVRALPQITVDNKVQLLPLLDQLISRIDVARQAGLINIPLEKATEIRAIYEVIKSGAVTLQGVVAAIKKPVPISAVPALVQ